MKETFPVSTLQFYYEVLGDTVEEIARKSRVPVSTITDLVTKGKWKHPDPLSPEDSAIDTQARYKKTREYITKFEVHRAQSLLARFAFIEDEALSRMEEAVSQLDPKDKDSITSLTKLVTSLTKLIEKHPLLAESITTPALIDRKSEGVNEKGGLEELLDALDGKGRTLPGQDNKETVE